MPALLLSFLLFSSCSHLFVSSGEITSHVQNILTLETVEHIYRSIVYYEGTDKLLGFIPIDSQKLLFKVNTRIRAGVNLAKGITINRKALSLHVILPAPSVLLVDTDENSLFQYFVKNDKKQLDWRSVSLELQKTKQYVKQQAIAHGILHRARINAEHALRSFFFLLGFSKVTFTWQEK